MEKTAEADPSEDALNRPMKHWSLTETILGCCFEVMNELGVGFLEAVYKNALIVALQQKGISVRYEVPFEIVFRGKKIGHYIADMIVEGVIIASKCCKCLLPEHNAQVINYLKAAQLTVGLLVNFGQHRLEFRRLYG